MKLSHLLHLRSRGYIYWARLFLRRLNYQLLCPVSGCCGGATANPLVETKPAVNPEGDISDSATAGRPNERLYETVASGQFSL